MLSFGIAERRIFRTEIREPAHVNSITLSSKTFFKNLFPSSFSLRIVSNLKNKRAYYHNIKRSWYTLNRNHSELTSGRRPVEVFGRFRLLKPDTFRSLSIASSLSFWIKNLRTTARGKGARTFKCHSDYPFLLMTKRILELLGMHAKESPELCLPRPKQFWVHLVLRYSTQLKTKLMKPAMFRIVKYFWCNDSLHRFLPDIFNNNSLSVIRLHTTGTWSPKT